MSNVLFLDFDGVLHPTSVPDEEFFCRMPFLAKAVDGLACDIVISSSWRHHHEAEQILANFSPPLRKKIVGFTGVARIGKFPRFQEIKNYLAHTSSTDWRALDDSFLEFPSHCPHLLLCNPNVGIEQQHVIAIRRWLKG